MAMNLYPDSNTRDTLQAGAEFMDFVTIVLQRRGIYLQPLVSKKCQFEIGESLQGWEVKLDRPFTRTNRLSIEIAEKTETQRDWVKSGIYRDDNTWLYIQGNFEYFFIFPKRLLRLLHIHTINDKPAYPEHETATVRAFYLPIAVAEKYGEKIIPNAADKHVIILRKNAQRAEYVTSGNGNGR